MYCRLVLLMIVPDPEGVLISFGRETMKERR